MSKMTARVAARFMARAWGAADDLQGRKAERRPAVQRLLTGKSFPSALLCSNDLTVMGAMRALFKCGLRVPSEVSVVGADDIPFSALTHPPLTTVRMPRERLSALALDILQQMLGGKGSRGTETVLKTELVIRESTGVARDSAIQGEAFSATRAKLRKAK